MRFSSGEGELGGRFDGRLAWEKRFGAERPRQVTGEAADSLQRGMQLPGPLNPPAVVERGHGLEFVRDEEIEGIRYHVLAATMLDGFPKIYCKERAGRLLVRSSSIQALHPGLDSAEIHIETLHSDFRVVQGVTMAFRVVQRDWVSGQQLSGLVWGSITVNPSLAPQDFIMPNGKG